MNVAEIIAQLWPVVQGLVATMIVAVLGKVLQWLFKRVDLAEEEKEAIIKDKIVDALKLGVNEVMENYVKEIKAKSADGKLTKDEALEARNKAITIAKDILKDKGIEIGKEFGDLALKMVINFIVEKFKLPKNV